MARTVLGHRIPETLKERLETGPAALLVIDLQNDFIHPDGYWPSRLGSAGLGRVVAPIDALATQARAAGTSVCFTKVSQLADGKLASPVWIADNLRNGAEPLHCMRETWGWQLVDELRVEPEDLVLEKYRRSAFEGTNLSALLRARGVTVLVVCGVAASGCVEATIRAAIEKDYFVVVPADCVADGTVEQTEQCLVRFRRLVSPDAVTTSSELSAIWRSEPALASRLPAT
jgi:nicotinamidase-related amidase